MRDEQVRRYARHILLPDLGGLGQTALLVSAALVDLQDDPAAVMIAASYLAAGGVGTVVLRGATEAQVAALSTFGPDAKIVAIDKPSDLPDHARKVPLPPDPAWWQSAEGDEVALAFWRGGIAATQWMASVGNK